MFEVPYCTGKIDFITTDKQLQLIRMLYSNRLNDIYYL